MGLFDRFKRDELLEAMTQAYGLAPGEASWPWRGNAHGRELAVRAPAHAKEQLEFRLAPQPCPAESVASFCFFRADATALARMPALGSPGWGDLSEEHGGARIGAGFALDWDVDVDSPLLARHGAALLGYLERFSPAARTITAELPWIIVAVDRAGATPQTMRRDVECADELLRFFEARRFEGAADLWRHSAA